MLMRGWGAALGPFLKFQAPLGLSAFLFLKGPGTGKGEGHEGARGSKVEAGENRELLPLPHPPPVGNLPSSAPLGRCLWQLSGAYPLTAALDIDPRPMSLTPHFSLSFSFLLSLPSCPCFLPSFFPFLSLLSFLSLSFFF